MAKSQQSLNSHIYLTYKFDLIKTEAIRTANEFYRRHLDGLVTRDLRVVRLIGDFPGLSVSELREKAFLEKTLLSKTLTNLVSLSLVKRVNNPKDNRQYFLWLTPKGKKLREYSDQLGVDMENAWLGELTDEERMMLDCICDKLIAHLGKIAAGHQEELPQRK